MKFIGSWKIRALGLFLLLSLAAGCFTGRWHRDNWSNNNGIREDDRGREGGWNSGGNADRDHDGRWQAERNSEWYSQGNSRDAH
jgi:hypothetical protein